MVVRLLKLILIVAVLAVVALIGYAYLGDLSPTQTEKNEQVTIEVE